jgi:hypothetical protein
MSFARLEKIKRLRARYPKAALRESTEDREYQQYLDSLSESELTELIHGKLEEYRNSPEGLATQARLEGMSEDQLMEEIKSKILLTFI